MFRNKVFLPTLKVLDEKTFRVEAIMSTENEDRDGDKIMSSGWDLKSFNEHPVLLSSHDYYSLGSQIGEWEDVKAGDGQLRGVARYYAGMGNSEADWGWQLAKMGKAAFSVGFIPKEWKEVKAADPRKGFWGSYIYEKQELLETSHVTIPSNREALQLMAKGMGPGLMKDLAAAAIKDLELWKAPPPGLKWPMGDYDRHCIVPGCDDAAAIYPPVCEEHLQILVNAPAEPPGGELDEEALMAFFAGVKGVRAKAGRKASQASLDQLHAARTHLDGMHTSLCDMGADCPETASVSDDDADETKLWSKAYVAKLPSSAFALAAGERRLLAHHNSAGDVDVDRVLRSFEEEESLELTPAEHARIRAHLEAHAKQAGVTPGKTKGADDLGTQLFKAAQAGLSEVVTTHG